MTEAELRALLTPAGLALLDSLPTYSDKNDVLRLVATLRKAGHPADLVTAVLSQAKLRAKAVTKFGPFAGQLLYTEAGLEQATRLSVAALHAGRFQEAGVDTVADLGCGIGADALALAALDLGVIAVERDEVTAALATYNLARFPEVTVEQATAEDFDLSRVAGVYMDPARRTAGTKNTRRVSPDDYSPSLTFAFDVASRMPTGIKLGPGLDRDLIPENCEAQWVSVDGDVVEMGLWFGAVARPGIHRSALVIRGEAKSELVAEQDSADVAVGELGSYLYEPDGAVIRARLIGDVARRIDARMIAPEIAYLSADTLQASPFVTAFEIESQLPFDVKTIAKACAERGIGTLEIKKRGVDADPAEFRKKLKLSGAASATLVLTRLGDKRVALLARRVN